MSSDPYEPFPLTGDAAKAAADWQAEWKRQLALLPEHKRNDIATAGDLSIYAEDLDNAVEKALASRGEKS